jgi:CBS domain-containing protein
MAEEGVGCLVVVADNQPTAIVTDRDLVLEVLCNNLDASAIRVGEIAAGRLVSVREDAPVAEAGHVMARHAVRRLPVVDEKGHLVGVVTADDLMRLVVGELAGLAAAVEVQAASPHGGSE